uniref:Uncharacterized protein n=1 Tax=Anguilla anguilla TaxID=7936 RepID=A0A0E9Q6K2_ANGAN
MEHMKTPAYDSLYFIIHYIFFVDLQQTDSHPSVSRSM